MPAPRSPPVRATAEDAEDRKVVSHGVPDQLELEGVAPERRRLGGEMRGDAVSLRIDVAGTDQQEGVDALEQEAGCIEQVRVGREPDR